MRLKTLYSSFQKFPESSFFFPESNCWLRCRFGYALFIRLSIWLLRFLWIVYVLFICSLSSTLQTGSNRSIILWWASFLTEESPGSDFLWSFKTSFRLFIPFYMNLLASPNMCSGVGIGTSDWICCFIISKRFSYLARYYLFCSSYCKKYWNLCL